MSRFRIGLTVALALALSLAVLPRAALAGHHRHHGGVSVFVGPVFPRHVFPRPFIPFGFFVPPAVVYVSPPVVYSPPPVVYASPPSVYYQPPAAPPPMPTVIQYPHGRYELRGDGITTPYVWVWIPNPPPPPPPAAPPAVPSASSPAASSAGVVAAAPRADKIYRFTDERGVTTFTNVPPTNRVAQSQEVTANLLAVSVPDPGTRGVQPPPSAAARR